MNDTPKNENENENLNEGANPYDDPLQEAIGSDVSDIKDDNSFDIELESLDDFLKDDESNSSDDEFSLGEDDFIPVTDQDKKGGSSAAKIAGYVVLVAMLSGAAYAGVKYLPKLTGADGMSVFEHPVDNGVADLESDFNTFTEVTQEQAATDPYVAPMNDFPAPMPMASDEGIFPVDDIVSTQSDLPFPEMDDPFGEINVMDAPTANSISDVVAITQDGFTDINDDAVSIIEEDPIFASEPADAFPVDGVAAEPTFANDPSVPMIDGLADVDLPPVSNEQIDAVDTVMNTDPAILEAVVEAQADTPRTPELQAGDIRITEIENELVPVVEVPSTPSEGIEVIEKVVVAPVTTTPTEQQVPTAPKAEDLKPVEVKEVKAVPPVRTTAPKKTAAPKPAPVVETKPAINAAAQLAGTSDARIAEGRAALRSGDFARAGQIFDDVLRQNPSNVHALTGKQMAVSKIRYTGHDAIDAATTPVEPAVRPTEMFVPRRSHNPDVPRVLQNRPQPTTDLPEPQQLQPQPPLANAQPPVVNTNTTDIQTIVAQANAMPQDASVALRAGDAFRAAGDRAKAAEWYRKALQLDAVYGGGIDRMAVYDRLGTVQ